MSAAGGDDKETVPSGLNTNYLVIPNPNNTNTTLLAFTLRHFCSSFLILFLFLFYSHFHSHSLTYFTSPILLPPSFLHSSPQQQTSLQLPFHPPTFHSLHTSFTSTITITSDNFLLPSFLLRPSKLFTSPRSPTYLIRPTLTSNTHVERSRKSPPGHGTSVRILPFLPHIQYPYLLDPRS